MPSLFSADICPPLAFKGGVWLHFEPKFVTDCKAHKTPAILCIFIEFFMQIDQPTV